MALTGHKRPPGRRLEYGRYVTQCRCDPEVVSVHLFTLATMVVCFAADCKHNNRKDKCTFLISE